LQPPVYTRMWRPAVVNFPLRLDYGRSPHAYVNQRLQIQLELLMMSGVPLETCRAFNERWINKLYYKVASCWLFLLSHVIFFLLHFNIPFSISFSRNFSLCSPQRMTKSHVHKIKNNLKRILLICVFKS
jgi:hypothetical protein